MLLNKSIVHWNVDDKLKIVFELLEGILTSTSRDLRMLLSIVIHRCPAFSLFGNRWIDTFFFRPLLEVHPLTAHWISYFVFIIKRNRVTNCWYLYTTMAELIRSMKVSNASHSSRHSETRACYSWKHSFHSVASILKFFSSRASAL